MQVTYTTAKDTKRARRVWIEGTKLAAAGFPAGTRYDLVTSDHDRGLTLEVNPNGSRKVSECNRGGKSRPIVDLHSKQVEQLFPSGARVRITFEQDLITITQHHEDNARESRERQFNDNAKNGTLTTGSLFTGGGVSTQAIHEGLGGRVKWIADCELKYIESAGANCLAVDDETAVIVGKVEEVESKYYSDVDVLHVTIPCDNVSKAGKAKHGRHETDDASVFGVVRAIHASNPAVIVSENVTAAQTSPVYALLRAELRRLGYKLFEQVLDSSHTDSFENRPRYWLTAISEGIAPDSLELPTVTPSGRTFDQLSDPAELVAEPTVMTTHGRDHRHKRRNQQVRSVQDAKRRSELGCFPTLVAHIPRQRFAATRVSLVVSQLSVVPQNAVTESAPWGGMNTPRRHPDPTTPIQKIRVTHIPGLRRYLCTRSVP